MASMLVGGRVPARRIVAAAHVAAGQAETQMQPHAPLAQAVFAACHAIGEFQDLDLVEVGAGAHVEGSVSRWGGGWKGIQTWNVVPCSPVSNVNEPPWRSSTIRRAVSRPSPVPRPTSLVVKNGSNTWEWI